MDLIVEKSTELGVAEIVPFYSERSVVHDLGNAKLDRWRRLAKTAAQQCGRERVPAVAEPIAFDALLERFERYDAVLFPWELAPRVPLPEALLAFLPQSGRLLIVVGPEGGFSHDEAEAASARGAQVVWLGANILRTETVALVLAGYIQLAFS
jgi:16S rRNA (uracil1498-N3)-methyltransferase